MCICISKPELVAGRQRMAERFNELRGCTYFVMGDLKEFFIE